MSTLTLEFPSELAVALGKRPADVASEIQLMTALRLFDAGRISSGLAARVAGLTRVEFIRTCGLHGVSVFQQTPEEIQQDVEAALNASHR